MAAIAIIVGMVAVLYVVHLANNALFSKAHNKRLNRLAERDRREGRSRQIGGND